MKLFGADRQDSMMSDQALARRGRHRRRGLAARLRVAQAVRVRAGRVLGAGAVTGVLTAVCVASALGLTHSGGGSIPGFHKPDNPFLHHVAATPDGGTGGRSLPAARAVVRRTDVPVPAVTASAPTARLASVPSGPASLLTPSPLRVTYTPHPSVSPTSYPSPVPSVSHTGTASPGPSASTSSYPSPAPSVSHTATASPSPSASSPSGY